MKISRQREINPRKATEHEKRMHSIEWAHLEKYPNEYAMKKFKETPYQLKVLRRERCERSSESQNITLYLDSTQK